MLIIKRHLNKNDLFMWFEKKKKFEGNISTVILFVKNVCEYFVLNVNFLFREKLWGVFSRSACYTTVYKFITKITLFSSFWERKDFVFLFF